MIFTPTVPPALDGFDYRYKYTDGSLHNVIEVTRDEEGNLVIGSDEKVFVLFGEGEARLSIDLNDLSQRSTVVDFAKAVLEELL